MGQDGLSRQNLEDLLESSALLMARQICDALLRIPLDSIKKSYSRHGSFRRHVLGASSEYVNATQDVIARNVKKLHFDVANEAIHHAPSCQAGKCQCKWQCGHFKKFGQHQMQYAHFFLFWVMA